MQLAHILSRSGSLYAQRPALISGDQVLLNYAGLAHRVAILAGQFRKLGLVAGDRIGLALKNSPEYLELLFAGWHAGLIVVPINAKLHRSEFEYILSNSGCRLCFVTPDLNETIAPLAESLPALKRVFRIGFDDYIQLCQGEPAPIQSRQPEDTAWLFYTSGTTGQPKGAMLTHRNLLTLCWCYFTDVDAMSPLDSILHAAPMSHGSGLYSLPHVMQGAANIIPASGGFDTAEVLQLLGQHKGVTMFLAPTMLKRLSEHPNAVQTDTSNLKTIVYGGGPMYLADLQHAHAVFGYKLAQIYGQGESPMTITALNKYHHQNTQHPSYRERLRSVGAAFSGIEVAIADTDDKPLPPGEIGEVLVRGDTVMAGYWQRPKATAEALRNGWLHTGDLGQFDEDGFLTLTDRSKDLIISGGSNIYPREIEEVLLRHPAVSEVSVVGAPDPDWGEKVVAFVVVKAVQSINPAELDQFCIEHMARFKRPREYRIIEALPKNNYGKILKTELRKKI